MHQIDLNCDLGESFGTYSKGKDEEILPLITSANIACGFHGGDPSVMGKTVRLALDSGVKIGAHPGLPDLIGFGRRNMDISPQETYDLVLYQIGALNAFVKAEGAKMQHVKPHGALYNMAANNKSLAEAIAKAVYKINPELILFGLFGSELIAAGKKIGLQTANEVFSDRTYQQDGTLTPRKEKNALIHNNEQAILQVTRMVKEGKVISEQGTDIEVQADTICIHGDGPKALTFAQLIRDSFAKSDISIRAIGEK